MQNKRGLLLLLHLACLHLFSGCHSLSDVQHAEYNQKAHERTLEELQEQIRAPGHLHAVRRLLERVIGDAASVFDVQLINKCRAKQSQCFYVTVQDGRVLLQGTAG